MWFCHKKVKTGICHLQYVIWNMSFHFLWGFHEKMKTGIYHDDGDVGGKVRQGEIKTEDDRQLGIIV